MDSLLQIRSFIPGRLRARHPSLKKSSKAGALTSFLKSFDGITDVVINEKIGSILLVWDPKKIDSEYLLTISEQYFGGIPEVAKSSCVKRTVSPRRAKVIAQNRALTGVLALCLLAVVPGPWSNTTIHTITGVGFTALLANHLYRHRKVL